MKIVGVKMLNRTGGSDDFVEFDLENDVTYIDLWQPTEHSSKVPAYHTERGSFLALSTMKDISRAYLPFKFESFDKSTVVNKRKVMKLEDDKDGTKVVFVDGSSVFVRKKFNK